ncbi:MAG: MFS transporter [Candidatus Hodarchaeota archaeon]
MKNSFNFQSVSQFFTSLDRNVMAILLVNLIWTVPWGLVQPFISPYFFELSQEDYLLTGLLNGLPYVSMIFSIFIFGWIVDKIGSKIVMLTGFFIFLVLFLTLIVITDPFHFFIDYVIFNGLLACFGPAVLKYASLTGKKDIFGALAASTSLGYFLGSVLAGFIFEPLGMDTLFLISLGVCTLGLIITFFTHDLRESPEEVLTENPSDPHNSTSPNIIVFLFKSKILIGIFVITILHNFQGSFSSMFITVYFLDELHAPALLIGIVFGLATLSGTVASHLVGKIGEKRGFKEIMIICYVGYLLVWGSFILSIGNYILPAISYTLPIYVGLIVAGPAVVANHVKESRRGTFMGIYGACQCLGLAVGSISGGMYAGYQGTFYSNFGVSAFFTVILIIITILLIKNGKKSD